MLCEYGCKSNARYKLRNGKMCCSKTYQSCEAIKNKNSTGLKKAYKTGRKLPIFNDVHRKTSVENRIKNLQLLPFEMQGSKLQRKFIEKEQNYKCLFCNIDSWLGKELKLQLDHIDGDTSNNKRNNLRLLCPNCHSQTDTYCGKNLNTGKTKVSDDILLETYNKYRNIHQTLLAVGLAAKGGNYTRMKKLLNRN